MSDKMCDMKKRVEENLNHIAGLVAKPKYICKKCARVANSAELICKPLLLPQGQETSKA